MQHTKKKSINFKIFFSICLGTKCVTRWLNHLSNICPLQHTEHWCTWTFAQKLNIFAKVGWLNILRSNPRKWPKPWFFAKSGHTPSIGSPFYTPFNSTPPSKNETVCWFCVLIKIFFITGTSSSFIWSAFHDSEEKTFLLAMMMMTSGRVSRMIFGRFT